ncbi:uncharacterized protein LOC131292888 isoform X1 [Anopheles ziemanni]|uniref:uncharacterized protein LOC131271229 isoform X1 n=1 Tax=Anopheles coustani TaxID=139045 RepID=UPI0026586897|nr:uncharacterized protein LOC131271229 isoform X1 [Anopheles coustani]XP_058176963.1 uncharacterized protein LOC131292888 isoform X1 [Anopheles ziemanni]
MVRYSANLAVLLMATVMAVHAETGFYVPKAYYTLTENGHKSPLIYVEGIPQQFVQRVRRSAQGIPTVPNFGFPVNFPAFQFPNPSQGGNFQSVSITSGSPGGLNNRFDENGQSAPAATINTFSSQNGHVTHTTHHIDKDGKVTTQNNRPQNTNNNKPPQKKN